MRILIEDKDLCTTVSAVFTNDPINAAIHLSKIAVDWTLTGGKDMAKDAAMNDTRMRNIAKQIMKGMLGPGDEVSFHFDGMDCMLSVLEDAGKHTGGPWINQYAFGPLTFIDSMNDRYNGNQGWENRVDESRPVPYGVGHSPDGTEY